MPLYTKLSSLPDWASARDFRFICDNMYKKRAARLGKVAAEKRRLESMLGGGGSAEPKKSFQRRAPGDLAAPLEPYEAEDVREAFASAIYTRGGGDVADIDIGPVDYDLGEDSAYEESKPNRFGGSATSAHIVSFRSQGEFQDAVIGAMEASKLLVVMFTAEWCPPCKEIKPKFVAMASQYQRVAFAFVDEANSQVFEDCGVSSMPTFKFFVNGTDIYTIVGGGDQNVAFIKSKITELLGKLKPAAKPTEKPVDPASSRFDFGDDFGSSPRKPAASNTGGGGGGGGGGIGEGLQKEKPKVNQKFKKIDEIDEDEDDEPDEDAVWSTFEDHASAASPLCPVFESPSDIMVINIMSCCLKI